MILIQWIVIINTYKDRYKIKISQSIMYLKTYIYSVARIDIWIYVYIYLYLSIHLSALTSLNYISFFPDAQPPSERCQFSRIDWWSVPGLGLQFRDLMLRSNEKDWANKLHCRIHFALSICLIISICFHDVLSGTSVEKLNVLRTKIEHHHEHNTTHACNT